MSTTVTSIAVSSTDAWKQVLSRLYALHQTERVLDAAMREAFGIGIAAIHTLQAVADIAAEGGMPHATAVVTRMGLGRTAMTAAVDRLAPVWLTRSPVLGDRRTFQLSLTERAHEALTQAPALAARALAEAGGDANTRQGAPRG